MYSIVDLFSGAGGLSYGFLQTGKFIVKAAYENNAHAQATYKRNHPNTEVYADVCSADYAELLQKIGRVDVVIGGPPCQGFSNANRQKNHAINKNNVLVKQFVRAIIELKPSAFVMENVSMLRSDTHRFYIDNCDMLDVYKYKIPFEVTEIVLLNTDYVFRGAQAIINSKDRINKIIWPEADYLALNIIYKMRKNADKRKKALTKYKNKLLRLSARLLTEETDNNHITAHNHRAAKALIQYYNNDIMDVDAIIEIEQAIMIQRMLGKAKELHDNNIVINHFSADGDLIAHVATMTVLDYIKFILAAYGYALNMGVLRAAEFGVPQKRERYVIIGVKKEICSKVELPKGPLKPILYATVKDAIDDISDVIVEYDIATDNGVILADVPYPISELGKKLRNSNILFNHIATRSTDTALSRFSALGQGENFHDLDQSLKTTYSDAERTQNTIYLRLKYNEPSGTVVNVRKSMWIHPLHNRALSIREAARLQTFPDSFVFCGTKDAQYQQVGNAVPPLLAKAIAERVGEMLDSEKIQPISEAI